MTAFFKLDLDFLELSRDVCASLLIGMFAFKADGQLMERSSKSDNHRVDLDGLTMRGIARLFKNNYSLGTLQERLEYLNDMGLVLRIRQEAQKHGITYRVCRDSIREANRNNLIKFDDWAKDKRSESRSAKLAAGKGKNFLPQCDPKPLVQVLDPILEQNNRDSILNPEQNRDYIYIPKEINLSEAEPIQIPNREREEKKNYPGDPDCQGKEKLDSPTQPEVKASTKVISAQSEFLGEVKIIPTQPEVKAVTKSLPTLLVDSWGDLPPVENNSQQVKPVIKRANSPVTYQNDLSIGTIDKPVFKTLEQREEGARKRYLSDYPDTLFTGLDEEADFCQWTRDRIKANSDLKLANCSAIARKTADRIRGGVVVGEDLNDLKAYRERFTAQETQDREKEERLARIAAEKKASRAGLG